MAIGKRRTRRIVVENREFRWRCDFHTPFEIGSMAFGEGRISSPDLLIVRPAEGPHRLLTLTWAPCQGPFVTPALVRAAIEEALGVGWLSEWPMLELERSRLP